MVRMVLALVTTDGVDRAQTSEAADSEEFEKWARCAPRRFALGKPHTHLVGLPRRIAVRSQIAGVGRQPRPRPVRSLVRFGHTDALLVDECSPIASRHGAQAGAQAHGCCSRSQKPGLAYSHHPSPAYAQTFPESQPAGRTIRPLVLTPAHSQASAPCQTASYGKRCAVERSCTNVWRKIPHSSRWRQIRCSTMLTAMTLLHEPKHVLR